MWGDCVTSEGIATIKCIGPIFRIVLSSALGLVGTVSLFLILAASILFITSGGGKQVEQAKNMLTYAIIGLVIVLLAYFIISLVAGITGVKCILFFGTVSCQ